MTEMTNDSMENKKGMANGIIAKKKVQAMPLFPHQK